MFASPVLRVSDFSGRKLRVRLSPQAFGHRVNLRNLRRARRLESVTSEAGRWVLHVLLCGDEPDPIGAHDLGMLFHDLVNGNPDCVRSGGDPLSATPGSVGVGPRAASPTAPGIERQ